MMRCVRAYVSSSHWCVAQRARRCRRDAPAASAHALARLLTVTAPRRRTQAHARLPAPRAPFRRPAHTVRVCGTGAWARARHRCCRFVTLSCGLQQPADILWEHLDTPFRSRMLRRLGAPPPLPVRAGVDADYDVCALSATAGIALLVLCVTFGLLLFAQVTNTEFQSKVSAPPCFPLAGRPPQRAVPAARSPTWRSATKSCPPCTSAPTGARPFAAATPVRSWRAHPRHSRSNVTSERTLFRPGTFKGEFDTACAEQDIGGFYVQFQGAILPSSPTACRCASQPFAGAGIARATTLTHARTQPLGAPILAPPPTVRACCLPRRRHAARCRAWFQRRVQRWVDGARPFQPPLSRVRVLARMRTCARVCARV